MMMYLDNNATTRPADDVVAAMTEALRTDWPNPSSVHRAGQAVRRRVELARAQISDLIGCLERELVFVSGGTEAANLAIRGSIESQPGRRVLVTSRLEHVAVRQPAEELERRGAEVVWLPNDDRGLIDPEALAEVLAERADEIALVAVMWANNETGVIQPIEALGTLCRERGVRFFTDATQCVGKMPIDMASLPVDLLGFSAHKFHGPKGVGALYVRHGVRLNSALAAGGPQERGRRGGTENVPGILGFGEAARLAGAWLGSDGPAQCGAMRDDFERRILDSECGASINGAGAPRLWTTSNVAFADLEAEPILLMFSERSLCASAGAACSSGSLEPSPVLSAMGIPMLLAEGSIRFSLSRETTQAEIDEALEIIAEVISRLRATLPV